jgi:hypothetical protein
VITVLAVKSYSEIKAKLCPAPVPVITAFCLMSILIGVGTRTSSSVPVPQLPCSFQPQLTILPVSERNEEYVSVHLTGGLQIIVKFMMKLRNQISQKIIIITYHMFPVC